MIFCVALLQALFCGAQRAGILTFGSPERAGRKTKNGCHGRFISRPPSWFVAPDFRLLFLGLES